MLCLETGIKGRDKWLHTTDVVGYKHLFMPLIPGSGTTILIYSTAHTTRHLNLQWSSDTIWRHRSGSMRALAMAWCLTTHHQRAISQEMFMNFFCNMCLENALLTRFIVNAIGVIANSVEGFVGNVSGSLHAAFFLWSWIWVDFWKIVLKKNT